MFERFTSEAREVVRLAQEEARTRLHTWVGTEHLLLAIVHKPETAAAQALKALGADGATVEAELERLVPRGTGAETSGAIPFTPRAKRALELALREALAHGHNTIATEHVLLGILRVEESVAAQALVTLLRDAERLRDELVSRMPTRPRRRRRASVVRWRRRAWQYETERPRWEYRVERPAGEEITSEWLNGLGADGWELAAPTSGGALVFKRRLALWPSQAEEPREAQG